MFLVDYLRMGFTLLFSELLLGGLNETNADLSPLCYVSLVENAIRSKLPQMRMKEKFTATSVLLPKKHAHRNV